MATANSDRIGFPDTEVSAEFLASAPVPIHCIDATGTIVWANQADLALLGFAPHERDAYIGRSLGLFHVDPRVLDELLARLSAGETVHDFEVRLRTRDGSLRHVVVSGDTQFRDGKPVASRCFSRDITARRHAAQSHGPRCHPTPTTAETVRMHDEFLSLASHELRTPLTVLQLQLDALRERAGDADRSTIGKLDRADRACLRLAELVEALLDVSRMATDQFALSRERADLAEIVAAAAERLLDPARAVGSTITVTATPVLGTWDRARITQVVSNLLSNAFRHAAGTPIAVTVTHDNAGAVVEVRDRGPGLPDGELGWIFERFERAASMRHVGGLGLGLYVVRRIVEAHGGAVAARNLVGGGACFTVRLPVAVA
ncbi:MAG TPA: PAS domain-containing sensor histidine kinase [Kofleriaceae bacterium]|nr:PAS domain-containing sensor histidine kinase [Kofleriaceae bacterium]